MRLLYLMNIIVGSIMFLAPLGAQRMEPLGGPDIDAALSGLKSEDVQTRMAAYYGLMEPFGGDQPGFPSFLLKRSPGAPDRVKSALIELLQTEVVLKRKFRYDPRSEPEPYAEYTLDLSDAVGKLRDPRAAKVLLDALVVMPSRGAEEGLAEICPAAVDVLIEALPDPEYTRNAILSLGDCLTRPAELRANPAVASKIRSALVAALDHQDWSIRNSAAFVLHPLRQDPQVRSKMEMVARTDQHVNRTSQTAGPLNRFTVRDTAQHSLDAPTSGDFFVSRVPGTLECRIQSGAETPIGEPMFGPHDKWHATDAMCKHVDPAGKDPTMCWLVTPRNACSEVQ